MTLVAFCARCKAIVAVTSGKGTTKTCNECGRTWGSAKR